jgi:hypothetical protein
MATVTASFRMTPLHFEAAVPKLVRLDSRAS